MTDTHGAWDNGIINLIINELPGENTAPVAAGDAYSIDEDAELAVTVEQGVLNNDTDAEGDSLSSLLVTGPSHGALVLNTDGSFTYTPAEDFSGTDSFTYRANDGELDSNIATVTITVNPVNDAPVLAPIGNMTVVEGQTLGFMAEATDVDAGDVLTYSLTDAPAGASIDPVTGVFTFTPTDEQATGVHVTLQSMTAVHNH